MDRDRSQRLSAQLIICSLACIALWVWLTETSRSELHRDLETQKRRRIAAEAEARKREQQLDGALAKISEINGVESEHEPAGPELTD
jgi:hypothetical protein